MPGVDRLLAGAEPAPPELEEMEARLERLQRRVDELERLQRPADSGPAQAAGYTLFFRGAAGYEIVDREGPAPPVGTPIIVAGRRLVVEGLRRSPFPGDERPCLVLSPPPQPPPST